MQSRLVVYPSMRLPLIVPRAPTPTAWYAGNRKRSANCVSRRESVLTGRAFGMLNGPGEQCAPQGRFCESDRGPLSTQVD